MMRLKYCLVLCLALVATRAIADDVSPRETFVTALQAAVRGSDGAWLAGHMRYPVRFYGKHTVMIPGKSWVLSHARTLVGAKLRAAVLAQNPADLFENWQGLMVGEGAFNIWIKNTGEGSDERYQIITINDSE